MCRDQITAATVEMTVCRGQETAATVESTVWLNKCCHKSVSMGKIVTFQADSLG